LSQKVYIICDKHIGVGIFTPLGWLLARVVTDTGKDWFSGAGEVYLCIMEFGELE